MAQQAKAPATTPANLSSIPRIHTVDQKNWLLFSDLYLKHAYTYTYLYYNTRVHVQTHTHTYTRMQ